MGNFPLSVHGLNITSFKRTRRKFASIVDYNALFSKEIVKDLSLLFEIFSVILIKKKTGGIKGTF